MSGGQSGIYSPYNCVVCGTPLREYGPVHCGGICGEQYEWDIKMENLSYTKAADALRDWLRLEWRGQDSIAERAIEQAIANIMSLRRIE